ncbi:MAG: dehydrogenase E1 component subunit alpha/beta [Caldilinea sp.]
MINNSLTELFYAQMQLIRRTEQTFFALYGRGLMAGTVHTSIGQEACAVGVVNALDRTRDVIFSNHRAHGHFLAYCDDVEGLVAELLGRRSGVVGGIGGTQHLHKDNFYTNGVQGGIVPNAVGAALAEKHKQSGAIVVVFLGDGTMGQGVVYESMNVAALWSLPLLFVLEDNQYAQSTHRCDEHAGSLAQRAQPFGIESAETEADDVFTVYAAAQRAVAYVRRQNRPFFLVLHTYRLAPHSKGDDTRSAEELQRYWARDPLARLAAVLPDAQRAAIDAAIEQRIEKAVEKALTDEVEEIGDWRLEIGAHQSLHPPIPQSPNLLISNLQSPISYLESLRQSLHTILEEDSTALVLGEDILDPYGGAFKVTKGLSTRFPDRVRTTPICEATIVGMSVGMALRGLHPIAEIMFGDFVALAADQIVNHAAKYPAMYNGQVAVPLVIRTPMGGGRGYGPTHSQSLERLFLGIPHLKIVAASHLHDAGALLRQVVADREPVIFVEHKLLYPLALVRGEGRRARRETERLRDWRLGVEDWAPVRGDGVLQMAEGVDRFGYPVALARNYGDDETPDVTVIAYGGMSRLLAPLLIEMAAEEIRMLACLPTCISPLDAAPLVWAAAQSGRVLVAEESPAAFGWGAEVATQVHALAGDRLYAPVARLGAAPTVIPAAKPLEDMVLPSQAMLAAQVVKLLEM